MLSKDYPEQTFDANGDKSIILFEKVLSYIFYQSMSQGCDEFCKCVQKVLYTSDYREKQDLTLKVPYHFYLEF